MDWTAFRVSLELGAGAVALLLPLSIALARMLAFRRFPGRAVVETVVALPLVLPPTVLGFYLLTAFGSRSIAGRWFAAIFGHTLAFSFTGLLVAAVIVNVPFAVQPIQRSFEAIPQDVRDAASACGMSPWRAFLRVEAPLAWPGILTAAILAFAHTLGEFGVVLMVGGGIPGQTRTLSVAIYDRVQAFDEHAAGVMSATLLALALAAMALVHTLGRRVARRS